MKFHFFLLLMCSQSFANQLILEKIQKKYILQQSILNSLLKEKTNSEILIVVRADRFVVNNSIVPKTLNCMSFDLEIIGEKQVYTMEFTFFVDLFYKNFIADEMFSRSRLVLLMNNLNSVFYFKSFFRSANNLPIIIMDIQNKETQFQMQPMYLIQTDKTNGIDFYIINSTETCVIPYLVQNSKYTLNGDLMIRTDYEVKEPNNCKILNIAFVLYNHLNENIHNQLKIIKEHYVYKTLDLIANRFGLTININSFHSKIGEFCEDQNGRIFTNLSEDTMINFNDIHWMIGKAKHGTQLTVEMILYLGYEDIVWLIINVPKTNTDSAEYSSSISVIFSLILITVFVEKLISRKMSYKFNFEKAFLISWSILFSVSVSFKPKHYFIRIIFFSWVVSSSVLTMCYYYRLFDTWISSKNVIFKNQEELIESGIKLYVHSLDYADIAFGEGNQQNVSFKTFFGHHGDRAIRNLPSFAIYMESLLLNGEHVAILTDRLISEEILTKHPEVSYYFLQQPVLTYPMVAYFSFSHKISFEITKILTQLKESGILDGFIKTGKKKFGVFQNNSDIDMYNYYFRVYVTIGFFYLWSITVFIGEILYFKFEQITKSNTQNNLIR